MKYRYCGRLSQSHFHKRIFMFNKTTLRYGGHSGGKKKKNSILFLLFLQKGKIIRIIDLKVSGFSVVAVRDNNESQEV